MKNHELLTDNPPLKRYVNKLENRIKFRIQTRYCLGFFRPKSMKLLGRNKAKITKD